MRKQTEILKELKRLKLEKKHFIGQMKAITNSDNLASITAHNFYYRRKSEAKKQIELLKWVLKIKKK